MLMALIRKITQYRKHKRGSWLNVQTAVICQVDGVFTVKIVKLRDARVVVNGSLLMNFPMILHIANHKAASIVNANNAIDDASTRGCLQQLSQSAQQAK